MYLWLSYVLFLDPRVHGGALSMLRAPMPKHAICASSKIVRDPFVADRVQARYHRPQNRKDGGVRGLVWRRGEKSRGEKT